MSTHKKIAIIGGGTNTYISNHLALSAPAYGSTAKILENKFKEHSENKMQVDLYLTKMADHGSKQRTIKDSIQFRKESLLTKNHSENNKRIISESIETLEKELLKYPEMDTPQEVEALVDKLIADPDTRVIIFNVAMVDYKPEYLNHQIDAHNSDIITSEFGKYNTRLSTSQYKDITLELSVQDKIIQKIRKERKDILLVGFKTTCGATKEEQFQKGLKLCKDASANIVFVNDVDKERIEKLEMFLSILEHGYNWETRNAEDEALRLESIEGVPEVIQSLQNNGLVTPEESSYWYNTREEALDGLVQMVLDRSHLHFTRSTVVDSETVPWNITQRLPGEIYELPSPDGLPRATATSPKETLPNPLIPETFRIVFDWVRSQGAYKKGPTGATVGHFGIKLGPNEFLTSKRKTDFNKIEEVGLVRVITDDPDDVFGYKHFFEENHDDQIQYNSDQAVIAFGAKPSVGGQSQRSLFETYPNLDCIVHFHCPLRVSSRDLFNATSQFSFECGSHECIASNITGFKEYKVSDTHSIWAGHMIKHGPNIVFNKDIDPQLVIDFINTHWDLTRKTDGLSQENK